MILPGIIKNMRLQLGETQSEFAKRYGVATNTVSRWETGTYDIPNKIVELILVHASYEKQCTFCDGTGKIRTIPVWVDETPPESTT